VIDNNYKFIAISGGEAHGADSRDYSQWVAALARRQINLLSSWSNPDFPRLSVVSGSGTAGRQSGRGAEEATQSNTS